MATPGFLVIVAHVEPEIREEFERWYHVEHLPEAQRALGAEAAWRMHCDTGDHVACYRLADLEQLSETDPGSPIAALISAFNARWPSGVERRRYYLKLVQEQSGPPVQDRPARR
jgi:hypothetical protein